MADYRAKKHLVLESLKKDLSKGFIEEEVSVQGHRFKMHTLNEEEEGWCDAFVNMSTPSSLLSSRRAPRVAASITSMDDIPLVELFLYPDDMTPPMRQTLEDNAIQKKYWLRSQMLYFLVEESDRKFVSELSDALVKMENRVSEVIKDLPKS